MSKVLVIEKASSIQALLKKQFSGHPVSVDSKSIVEASVEKVIAREYDVLIWDALASKTEQSKGLELLDMLTKHLVKTCIIIATEQESGSFPLDRLKTYAHRTIMRPVNEDEIWLNHQLIVEARRPSLLMESPTL
jgi:DNA-binding NtrC family response regulator